MTDSEHESPNPRAGDCGEWGIDDHRELPLMELIYPHRLDVVIRVHALQAMDRGGPDEALSGPYGWFISQWRFAEKSGQDPQRQVRRFADLYEAMRGEGYDRDRPMTVVRSGSPHPAFLPPERKLASLSVSYPFSLRDGAHRLAILLHFGWREATFRLVEEPAFAVPDYTTYCLERMGPHRLV